MGRAEVVNVTDHVGWSCIGRSFDPGSLLIAAVASIVVLVLLVYFSLKIDWGKLIGRWFPWAVQETEEDSSGGSSASTSSSNSGDGGDDKKRF